MPYVERNHKGEIIGLYGLPQPQPNGTCLTDPDPLPDDDPEVLAFRAAHPFPEVEPLTSEERQRLHQWSVEADKDHKKIRDGMLATLMAWSELENTLCALFYTLINRRDSHVAHEIYFAIASLDGRLKVVDVTFERISKEQLEIQPILPFWKKTLGRIGRLKKARNAIAHGMPISISIGNKPHARLASPFMDIRRFDGAIEKGQLPGLSANDLHHAVKAAHETSASVDELNRAVKAIWDGDRETFHKTLNRLEASLKKNMSS